MEMELVMAARKIMKKKDPAGIFKKTKGNALNPRYSQS
jgi:hypothetical protein